METDNVGQSFNMGPEDLSSVVLGISTDGISTDTILPGTMAYHVGSFSPHGPVPNKKALIEKLIAKIMGEFQIRKGDNTFQLLLDRDWFCPGDVLDVLSNQYVLTSNGEPNGNGFEYNVRQF